jgi:hypothetical protein
LPLNLPKPVAAYFAADKRDGRAVASCFTERAVVKDEGRTFSGLAAIRRWKAETSRKYIYAIAPIACEVSEGRIAVVSRLTGNFPGSPVDVRFLFELEGDRIASLEIIP